MAIKHLNVYLQGTTCGISMMLFQVQGVNLNFISCSKKKVFMLSGSATQ